MDKPAVMNERFQFTLPVRQPVLVVISGLSGVGKDAVLNSLKVAYPQAHYVVTCTDRAPRPGEVNGVDYFFVTTAEFERMIENDDLIEYSWVYEQYKGGLKKQVFDALKQGKDVIMRLDVQGAEKIKAKFPEAVLVFISPASEEEWRRRLLNRKTDTPEQIKVRLNTANQEMEQLDNFDYVVLNAENQLNKAVADIISIITAEHSRVHQRKIIA
ncbi:MAG: guanylate kinase [Anaerolineaceae bacterium]